MKLRAIIVSLFTLLLFMACSGNKVEPQFGFAPGKPKPGELITIRYNPDSTKLNNSKIIKAFVYFYEKDLIKTEESVMKNEDGIFKATFKVPDTAKGLVVKFTDDEGIVSDNNNNKGYFVKLYDKDDKIIAGANAGLAYCYANWGYNLDIETDRELAFSLFNEEFSKNPELKDHFLDTYLFLVNRLNSADAEANIKKELSAYEGKSELSEKVLISFVTWFTKFNDEKAKAYETKLFEKFPKSLYFQSKKYSEFREASIENKIKIAVDFEKEYIGSEYIDGMFGRILFEMVQQGKYNEAKEFAFRYKSKIGITRFLQAVEMLSGSKENTEIAMALANYAIEKAEIELDTKKGKVPEYLSLQEWEKSLKSSLGYAKYGMALVQKEMNDNAAFENLKSAYELTLGKEPELNLAYAKELVKKGKFAEAQTILEKDIKLGLTDKEGEDVLKQAFTGNKKNKDSYEKYLDGLKAVANAEMIAKIKSNLVNLPAPDFKLADAEGKFVSLSDLKGKVVIIDFWATWCGPCMSSFPGMKTAVEKYSNSNEVKFLFINVWENVDNKIANVKEFLKKTGYPFHVLLDLDNKVVESYKVTGIPTKIFIDKEGKIRYKSVGFNGNPDEMVKEIENIINLIK